MGVLDALIDNIKTSLSENPGTELPTEVSCPSCGLKGKLYPEGGSENGIFEVVGRTEDGSLVVRQCPGCQNSFKFDISSGTGELV